MTFPRRSAVPQDSTFAKFLDIPGAYTDCYVVQVNGAATLSAFTNIFFDTWLFRLEILILRAFGKTHISPTDREMLANGRADRFGVWHVDERTDTEMILNVGTGPIRTWLRVERDPSQPSQSTLMFGSAVLPTRHSGTSQLRLDRLTQAFTPLHRVYSILLLWSAALKWAVFCTDVNEAGC